MTNKNIDHNFLKISLKEIDMPFRYHESYAHSLHWDARQKAEPINLNDIDLLSMGDMQRISPHEHDLLTQQKLS